MSKNNCSCSDGSGWILLSLLFGAECYFHPLLIIPVVTVAVAILLWGIRNPRTNQSLIGQILHLRYTGKPNY